MPRTARMVASLVLVVLSSVLVGCSGAGKDNPAVVTETHGVATGSLFLYGTITRDKAPVRGANLEVQLDNEREAADAEVGDVIHPLTAAKVRTDSRGRYAIRITADDLPTKYFLGGTDRSSLNFRLFVTKGDEFVVWGGTMSAVGHPTVWRTDDQAVAADAAMRMDQDLGTRRRTVTDSYGETEKSEATVVNTRRRPPPATPSPSASVPRPPACEGTGEGVTNDFFGGSNASSGLTAAAATSQLDQTIRSDRAWFLLTAGSGPRSRAVDRWQVDNWFLCLGEQGFTTARD